MPTLRTGPVQVHADAPGVYIAGPEAWDFAATLFGIARHVPMSFSAAEGVRKIAAVLESCRDADEPVKIALDGNY
jgi:hypothetical protein